MLRPLSFANALTLTAGGIYVICAILSLMAPNFLMTITQSWFHIVNLEVARVTQAVTFGSFMLGLISLTIITWLVSYSTAAAYNILIKVEQSAERFYKSGIRWA